MGAAYHASQDRVLWEKDDNVADLEFLDGVRKAIAFCPSRTVGEWVEITSRSFGFDEVSPGFRAAILKQIEASST